MSFLQPKMALLVLAAGSMGWMACGSRGTETSAATGASSSGSGGASTGSMTSSSSGTGQGGSGTGGQSTSSQSSTGAGGQSSCGPGAQVSYETCGGTSFFPDGTCLDGSCATVPLETRVFKEWQTQIKALSGLSDAAIADRIKVAKVSHSGGPNQVFVRIDYVVVLDWVRSRQADSPELGNSPLVNPPSDAEITAAVKLGIESAEWTGLGAIGMLAPEPATQAAFDGCACDMTIDFCHIDFENVTGKLVVPGIKQVDAAQNKCKSARVDVSIGKAEACMDTPCSIN